MYVALIICCAVWPLLIVPCAGQATIFSCDFDSGLTLGCSFLPTIAGFLELSPAPPFDVTAPQRPIRPLSDVTSITTLINGYRCNLPYRVDRWDIYFCLRDALTNVSTCPTDLSSAAHCAAEGQLTFVRDNVDAEQCLTFYYYFTDSSRNPTIEVVWQSRNGGEASIVLVTPQPENRWHRMEASFVADVPDYALKFYFRRESGADTTEFYFALDNILITAGQCGTFVHPTTSFTTLQTSAQLETETSLTETQTTFSPSSSPTSAYASETTMTSNEHSSTDTDTLASTTIPSTPSISSTPTVEATTAPDELPTTDTSASAAPPPPPSTPSLAFTHTSEASTTLDERSSIDTFTSTSPPPSTSSSAFAYTSEASSSSTPRAPSTHSPSSNSVPLAIGLSLGLGVPFLLLSTIALVYYVTCRPRPRVAPHTRFHTRVQQ